ncbi:MAG: hypothetical protein PWP35_2367 [Bacteroidales bacterium]|jgi:hypothetical protein|nr:hypothetical protein [Bacteroidales bacterium]
MLQGIKHGIGVGGKHSVIIYEENADVLLGLSCKNQKLQNEGKEYLFYRIRFFKVC